jgi:hypothetical protein
MAGRIDCRHCGAKGQVTPLTKLEHYPGRTYTTCECGELAIVEHGSPNPLGHSDKMRPKWHKIVYGVGSRK